MQLYKDPIVLDVLIEQLEVPGKASVLKRLTERESKKPLKHRLTTSAARPLLFGTECRHTKYLQRLSGVLNSMNRVTCVREQSAKSSRAFPKRKTCCAQCRNGWWAAVTNPIWRFPWDGAELTF